MTRFLAGRTKEIFGSKMSQGRQRSEHLSMAEASTAKPKPLTLQERHCISWTVAILIPMSSN